MKYMTPAKNKYGFTCSRCGRCCRWHGYVSVSEKEAEDIADFIGMDLSEFYKNMTMPGDDGGVSLTENEDGSCPFHIASPSGCRIYEHRPLQCRTYPHEWNNPGEPCPGVG